MPNVMLWGEDVISGKPSVIKVSNNNIESFDWVHSRVHTGVYYTLSYINTALASGGNIDLLIIPGATYTLHCVPSASIGADGVFYVYEGTTVSGNGTALTAVNNNYVSTNTAEGAFYHTPTVTGTGTAKYSTVIPGGSGVFAGGASGGGPIRSGTEIILKTSTNYLIRLHNQSSSAAVASLGLGFYEL